MPGPMLHERLSQPRRASRSTLIEPFLVAQSLFELSERRVEIARLMGVLRLDQQRACKGPARQPGQLGRQLPIDGIEGLLDGFYDRAHPGCANADLGWKLKFCATKCRCWDLWPFLGHLMDPQLLAVFHCISDGG